jgi:hypothetical protein
MKAELKPYCLLANRIEPFYELIATIHNGGSNVGVDVDPFRLKVYVPNYSCRIVYIVAKGTQQLEYGHREACVRLLLRSILGTNERPPPAAITSFLRCKSTKSCQQ